MKPKKRQFDVRPITLGTGWSGQVLVGCDVSLPLSPPEWPDVERWRSALEDIIGQPVALPNHVVIKCSPTGDVFRASFPGDESGWDMVAKQSRPRGWWQGVLGRLGPSRARRNWGRALELIRCGIGTATPLAILERSRPRREAWLITQAIPEVVDLDRIVLSLLPRLDPAARRRVKSALIARTVELLARLEQHGLTHRDLKASNILFTSWNGQDGPPQAWIVDLDGLSRRKPGSERRRWQPLVRLAASLVSYAAVTRTDYCRFMRSLLAEVGRPPRSWKHAWRRLAPRVAAYVQASQKRKRDKLDGYAG